MPRRNTLSLVVPSPGGSAYRRRDPRTPSPGCPITIRLIVYYESWNTLLRDLFDSDRLVTLGVLRGAHNAVGPVPYSQSPS